MISTVKIKSGASQASQAAWEEWKIRAVCSRCDKLSVSEAFPPGEIKCDGLQSVSYWWVALGGSCQNQAKGTRAIAWGQLVYGPPSGLTSWGLVWPWQLGGIMQE